MKKASSWDGVGKVTDKEQSTRGERCNKVVLSWAKSLCRCDNLSSNTKSSLWVSRWLDCSHRAYDLLRNVLSSRDCCCNNSTLLCTTCLICSITSFSRASNRWRYVANVLCTISTTSLSFDLPFSLPPPSSFCSLPCFCCPLSCRDWLMSLIASSERSTVGPTPFRAATIATSSRRLASTHSSSSNVWWPWCDLRSHSTQMGT